MYFTVRDRVTHNDEWCDCSPIHTDDNSADETALGRQWLPCVSSLSEPCFLELDQSVSDAGLCGAEGFSSRKREARAPRSRPAPSSWLRDSDNKYPTRDGAGEREKKIFDNPVLSLTYQSLVGHAGWRLTTPLLEGLLDCVESRKSTTPLK